MVPVNATETYKANTVSGVLGDDVSFTLYETDVSFPQHDNIC